ncbi:hypothetical protein [uncultured Campylobacter sp.]|nr:hypothetical protein [uncultured Campylobacter sp.]
MSTDTRNFIKRNFGGLNFTAAILKFTRLRPIDLNEPPFVANLLPV